MVSVPCHRLREKEAQCLWTRPKSVSTWESLGNSLTLSVLYALTGEFSEGTLYEWPNLLVGVQEPTLIVTYLRRVTERNLRKSWAEEAPNQVETLLLP